jgi:hypothetical protein
MTPRSIRRAAERRANKLARKSAQDSAFAPADSPSDESIDSVAETATVKTLEPTIIPAAAANLHLCAAASGLTSQVTLLPSTDATQYNQLRRDYQNEYQPVGLQESNLVQTLAEATWRGRRLVALEFAIFAKGRIEFAEQFAAHNPELRAPLIELHTFLTYEKQIRGLQLQEARLSRRASKATAELRTLQQERRQREQQAHRAQEAGAKQTRLPATVPQPAAQNGFVFSNPQNAPHFTSKQAAQDESAAAA